MLLSFNRNYIVFVMHFDETFILFLLILHKKNTYSCVYICACLHIFQWNKSIRLIHTLKQSLKVSKLTKKIACSIFLNKIKVLKKCMHQNTVRINNEKKYFFWDAENHYFRKKKQVVEIFKRNKTVFLQLY